MTAWQLKVLGEFALRSPEGKETTLSTRKDRLLLAYLALQDGRPQTRDRLCSLLWANRAEPQARGSLRQSLATIRDTLGGDPLRADRDTVSLDPSLIETDALLFIAHAKARENDTAVLFGGELLQGMDPPTPESEQWLRSERQRLEDVAAEFVVEVAKAPSGAPPAGTIALARQLLERDRLREPLHRALMRLLVRSGDRAGALKSYAGCRDALKAELGISPDIETEQLYRNILTGGEVPSTPPVSERPTLAVLPFANPGNDPELVALCEGLAEDITTGLGRFRLLFVIDRYSAAEVAKLTRDSSEIGRRLGVAFVVQGSLVRLPGRLRLAVALVNTASRKQVWSESFDVPESDIPAVPERIVYPLINMLHGRVEHTLIEEARRKPTLAAYECLLRGIKHLRGYGSDDNMRAIELFQKARELDPDYALAYAYRAFADVVFHDYENAPRDILERSKTMVEEAIEIDPEDARCHWLLGVTCAFMDDDDSMMRHYRRAMELNPTDANIKATYGVALAKAGRCDEGIAIIAEAMRLNPYHPQWYWEELGNLLFAAGRYDDAVEALRHRGQPVGWVLARLAASYALLDRIEEARRTVVELLRVNPDAVIAKLREGGLNEIDKSRFAEGLRKAGLPE